MAEGIVAGDEPPPTPAVVAAENDMGLDVSIGGGAYGGVTVFGFYYPDYHGSCGVFLV